MQVEKLRKGVNLMILENYLDFSLDTEDDRSMKIFEKSSCCGNKDMHRNEIILDSDDSDMKIFITLLPDMVKKGSSGFLTWRSLK